MSSDRMKRKEITSKQRWIMKHKDRKDDIPNCPSIESIVKMPISNEATQSENSVPNLTEAIDSSLSDAASSDGTAEQQTISTGREISDKSRDWETSILPKRFLRGNRRRNGRLRKDSNDDRQRNLTSPISISEFAIHCTASERRDDIPMCPDIQNICDIEQSVRDDDMSVHRFSNALQQLRDDFVVLVTKFSQFLKDHPRPATITGFIIGSYLLISYLELSIAALIEFIAQTLWPISHAILLLIERLSINFGSFMHSSDDIMRGAYCDVAEIWCKHFEMMCADRCSFFSMAVERLRTN